MVLERQILLTVTFRTQRLETIMLVVLKNHVRVESLVEKELLHVHIVAVDNIPSMARVALIAMLEIIV
jgi:hypothetical protein